MPEIRNRYKLSQSGAGEMRIMFEQILFFIESDVYCYEPIMQISFFNRQMYRLLSWVYFKCRNGFMYDQFSV